MPESDLSKEALSGTHVDTVLPFFHPASCPAKTSVDQELKTLQGLDHDDPNPANLGRYIPKNQWKCIH